MDVVETLARLIAADTRNPGGDEPAMARLCASLLSPLTPDVLEVVEVPRPRERAGEGTGAYVFAAFGRPRTIVNIHLDTVPVNAGWTGDPHRARVDGDRITGLGAADTKGAIAVLLAAIEKERPRDLGVLLSGDEERGGSCLHEFLRRPAAREIERAVVCEPTGCRVGVRHRGMIALEASFQGAGGHSSQADRLPKPMIALARFAVALDDLARRATTSGPPDFPGLCVNVADLSGGVAFNVVPDAARMVFSLRPAPGADIDALLAEVHDLARAVDPAIAVRVTIDHRPFQTGDLPGFRKLLGARIDTAVPLPYWTEACVLAQAGIDAVVFGPGDVAQAHAPDEYVTRSDLATAELALREVILGAGTL